MKKTWQKIKDIFAILEIWNNKDEWYLGKKHWLPANFGAPAHYQIRWLWFGITFWKRKLDVAKS